MQEYLLMIIELMELYFIENESGLRLSLYLFLLLLFTFLETLYPRRTDMIRRRRWLINLSLPIISIFLLRLLIPISLVTVAMWSESNSFGLLRWLDWPEWLEILLALVLLDFSIYWQHRLFHKSTILWRIHRLHHSDLGFDVTTALRFHPFEIILSLLFKIGLVLIFGISALTVVLFEMILNGASLFNHSNWRLPKQIDTVVRSWLVTPDMHRIHHSVLKEETDSNFGFCLSCWDRWFGSYRQTPEKGQLAMQIGLIEFQAESHQRLDRLLLQPFHNVRKEANAPLD